MSLQRIKKLNNVEKTWIEQIVLSELEIFYVYQNIIKKNEKVKNLAWVFELKFSRKKAISELLKSYNLFGIADLSSLNRKINANTSKTTGIAKKIFNEEKRHLNNLKNKSNEYYCPDKCKELIQSVLVPISKRNIVYLKNHLSL